MSPTYADEIQRPEYGHGLDGVIRARRDRLTGILNGIDHDEWNPAADPHLPAPFDVDRLPAKAASKRALLERFGIPVSDETLARPVIGMVSRMVDQKGLDLIAAIAPQLASLDATFTIVGTGEPRYQEMWRQLSQWRPDRISAFIGFDEPRAHLVEAGADMFLMPSRFEPCGLNQMYSLRYGTVPIVRAVGGLVDTVRPYNPKNGQGTGFLFSRYDPGVLLQTLEEALAAFANKKVWNAAANQRHAGRLLVGPLGGRVCQNIHTTAPRAYHAPGTGIQRVVDGRMRDLMASENVKALTDADFGESVKKGVVLVDFWATWCAPCRRIAPIVDQLADEYNGRATVAKVDIDENPDDAQQVHGARDSDAVAVQGRRSQGNRGWSRQQGRSRQDDRQAPLSE